MPPDAPPTTSVARIARDLRAALGAFGATPRVLALVWRAQRGYAAALLGLSLLQGLHPLAEVWLAKQIVDGLATARLGPGDPWDSAPTLMGVVALRAGLAVLNAASQAPSRFVWQQLGDCLTRDVNRLILVKANSLRDIALFENPRFHDQLLKAQHEAGTRPINMLRALTSALRTVLTLCSMLAVLGALGPGLVLVVVGATLPHVVVLFRQGGQQWQINDAMFPEVRKMGYLRRILTSQREAKEIRLFGLGDHFLSEYLRSFAEFHRRYATLRWQHWRWNTAFALLSGLGAAASYGYVVWLAALGAISVGGLVLYAGALAHVRSSLSDVLWQVGAFYRDALFSRNLFSFLDLAPTMEDVSPSARRPPAAQLTDGVELRNVGFAYPGVERAVLRDVSITIRPGQTVALVGENGAGKTTLVKLITRLYDPTSGQVLVDRVDLRQLDLDAWRRRIAVVFQDSAHYSLTARENIGVGNLALAHDEGAVRRAAALARADTVVERLPAGYDTVLGAGFAAVGRGAELSGGEWQKVALARAFMRVVSSASADGASGDDGAGDGAQLLILDEPTAALDARAEHELYQRFRELTRGRATLLISHRFSTVRMADHIAVLEDGRITEQGSHDDLIARSGTYARLYAMQAERYLESASEERL